MELSAPDYVILIVEDLDRTLDFYTQVLGLRLGHRAGDYAQMETGTTRLGFYTRTAMAQAVGLSLKKPAPDATGFEIGFKVPDVDAAYNELVEKGAVEVTPPTTRPWGQRTAYVRDPDGHLIELAQDLGTRA
jgi:catechol 2,3-dioxygenase-like lactoylglutathione lyase family enzyme